MRMIHKYIVVEQLILFSNSGRHSSAIEHLHRLCGGIGLGRRFSPDSLQSQSSRSKLRHRLLDIHARIQRIIRNRMLLYVHRIVVSHLCLYVLDGRIAPIFNGEQCLC